MQLLVIFLADYSHLEDIMKKFRDLKISGVTVLDSSGLGQVELHSEYSTVSAYKLLHKIWDSDKEPSKTLLTVVENEDVAKKAMKVLEEIVGDLTKSTTAVAFTIPIFNVTGLKTIE